MKSDVKSQESRIEALNNFSINEKKREKRKEPNDQGSILVVFNQWIGPFYVYALSFSVTVSLSTSIYGFVAD